MADDPGVATYDVMTGTSTPLATDEVRFTMADGSVVSVRLEEDYETIRVCNLGERRPSGLSMSPRAHNVLILAIAP